MVTEHELEERAVAPRVTLEQVQNSIMHEFFFTGAQAVRAGNPWLGEYRFEGNMKSLENLTFCILVLKNGFTVVGKSACADPKNYQKDIGERIARENAVKQIWELLGFELCTKLQLIASQVYGS